MACWWPDAVCACGLPGGLQIPQETLYKKNVLLVRGRFRPFTLLHNDMLMGAPAPLAPDPARYGLHPVGEHLLTCADMHDPTWCNG